MKCDKLFHPDSLIFVAVTFEPIARLYKLLIALQTESLWVYSSGRKRPNKSIPYCNSAAVPVEDKYTSGARLSGTAPQKHNIPCLSVLTSSISFPYALLKPAPCLFSALWFLLFLRATTHILLKFNPVNSLISGAFLCSFLRLGILTNP